MGAGSPRLRLHTERSTVKVIKMILQIFTYGFKNHPAWSRPVSRLDDGRQLLSSNSVGCRQPENASLPASFQLEKCNSTPVEFILFILWLSFENVNIPPD
jgi:hypothetical protein